MDGDMLLGDRDISPVTTKQKGMKMIMEPNRNDKLRDLGKGFEIGTNKVCEMLEAYDGILHPEVAMGMLYALFCAGYNLSREDFRAMDHLVEQTLDTARQDSKEIMDEEAREMK
jgi:hypothetical protein